MSAREFRNHFPSSSTVHVGSLASASVLDPHGKPSRDVKTLVYFDRSFEPGMALEIIGYATGPRNEQPSPVPGVLRVEVAANGKPERTLEFTPATRQQFIELPVVCVNDEMLVRFNYDYLIAPSEDGRSQDTCKLGTGIVGDPMLYRSRPRQVTRLGLADAPAHSPAVCIRRPMGARPDSRCSTCRPPAGAQ